MMQPNTMRTTRTRLQKYQEEKRCGESGGACLKQQEWPQQYWSAMRHLGRIRKFKIEIKALFCSIIVKLVEVLPTYLYINV